jgi:cytolysin (calcineurin-like family phosphatase)
VGTLYEFITSDYSTPTSYNEDGKNYFQKVGRQFLFDVKTVIDKKVQIQDFRVDYNKGGIAVSGDHSLKIMLTDDYGFVLYISEPTMGGLPWAMARTITSMTDHAGGENVWIKDDYLETPEKLSQYLLERFRPKGGAHGDH